MKTIFSLYRIKSPSDVMFVKKFCLRYITLIFHQRNRALRCDICGKCWLCMYISYFIMKKVFQMRYFWKLPDFVYKFSYFVMKKVFLLENVSFRTHVFFFYIHKSNNSFRSQQVEARLSPAENEKKLLRQNP